jgi:hypothetical protein
MLTQECNLYATDESNEPDYNEDEDQLEEKQEEKLEKR